MEYFFLEMVVYSIGLITQTLSIEKLELEEELEKNLCRSVSVCVICALCSIALKTKTKKIIHHHEQHRHQQQQQQHQSQLKISIIIKKAIT